MKSMRMKRSREREESQFLINNPPRRVRTATKCLSIYLFDRSSVLVDNTSSISNVCLRCKRIASSRQNILLTLANFSLQSEPRKLAIISSGREDDRSRRSSGQSSRSTLLVGDSKHALSDNLGHTPLIQTKVLDYTCYSGHEETES